MAETEAKKTRKKPPPRQGPSLLSPVRVQAHLRRDEAVELRRQGKTFRQIAQALDVAVGTARRLVQESIKRLIDDRNEVAKDVLQRSLNHLEDLREAVWDDAMNGDTKAVLAALAIIDRESRMLGLDAPSRTESRMQFAGIVAGEDLESRARQMGISLEALRGPAPPLAARIMQPMEVLEGQLVTLPLEALTEEVAQRTVDRPDTQSNEKGTNDEDG